MSRLDSRKNQPHHHGVEGAEIPRGAESIEMGDREYVEDVLGEMLDFMSNGSLENYTFCEPRRVQKFQR